MAKKLWNVLIMRPGYATVAARSQQEAWDLANKLQENDILWGNDYDATDVSECEDGDEPYDPSVAAETEREAK